MNPQAPKSSLPPSFIDFRAAFIEVYPQRPPESSKMSPDIVDLTSDVEGKAGSSFNNTINLDSDFELPSAYELPSRLQTRAGPSRTTSSKTLTPKNGPSLAKSSVTNSRPNYTRPLLPASVKPVPYTTSKASNTPPSGSENGSANQFKISPRSSGKRHTTTRPHTLFPRGRPLAATESDDSSLSDMESAQSDDGDSEEEVSADDEHEDENMDEEMVDQSIRDSPETPTKLPSRSDSNLKQSHPQSIEPPMGSSMASLLLLRPKKQQAKIRNTPPKQCPRDQFSEVDIQDKSVLINEDWEEQLGVEKLQEKLQKFNGIMQEDHANTVRWLLYDARRAAEDRKSSFIDKVSPFESLKPQHVTPDSIIPEDSTIITMDSYLNKKKSGKTRVEVITKMFTDLTTRVPRYYSYTAVRRNILSPNDEKLRFIPFLGDTEGKKKTFTKLVTELEQAHTLKRQESGRKAEQLAQIRAYIDSWINNLALDIDRKQLLQYFFNESSEEIDLEPKHKKLLLASRGISQSPRTVRQCAIFSQAFDNVFKYSLRDVIVEDKDLIEGMEASERPNDDISASPKDVRMNGTDEESVEPGSDRLNTYADMGCTICGAIWCQTHGDYTQQHLKNDGGNDSDTTDSEDKGDYSYDFRPVIMRYDDLLRKQDVRLAQKPPELDLEDSTDMPCSDNCYLIIDSSKMEYDLSPEDHAKIRGMAISLREKRKRPCDISFLLDLPCWQIQAELNTMEPRTVEINSPGRPRRPEWYDNKRKVLRDNWADSSRAHLHQDLAQANPCAHDGPCLSNCQCYSSNVLCEALCGCADDCPRKWTGCSCHASGTLCTTESCICILMNRECGPQCVSCGAVPRIDPANKYHDELFATGCQNVPLQRGVPRKVILGESQLAGFGLYLAESVRKGQFIMEYAGEVVSGNEAERRGIIYDRKLLSFLFDLNNEWVVDAARLGNNSRFINHAEYERDGLNCEAKIVLVNGEHRIKFVALRDLKEGEELLFNYGKKFAEKHGLSKKLPKANARGKVEGEDALAALDGVNLARRATRGKLTSVRGGRGGTRTRKARKTAPLRELVKEVQQAVENGEGGENTTQDEEDEEDQGGDMKKKRKITRPARYTR